jgi:hypothetical protein
MSLAVPLRLTVLFRLPRRWGVGPENRTGRSRPIDPCAMNRYLRRDIGLENFPCTPARDLLHYR